MKEFSALPVLNLHAMHWNSRANGPGNRAVFWFQGCSLRCLGCFNPETHAHAPRLLVPVSELLGRIEQCQATLEGITVSGGEPLEQPTGLLHLLCGIRERTRLSVVLFSGLTRDRIKGLPVGPEILAAADILIAGPFVRELRMANGLRGSSNQEIRLLSNRYDLDQITGTPVGEVHIDPRGIVSVTGIDPPTL
jgi:anaerobic ribonucleoside-triphosphate reductase activating protein